jgi:hypothetical protein
MLLDLEKIAECKEQSGRYEDDVVYPTGDCESPPRKAELRYGSIHELDPAATLSSAVFPHSARLCPT